MVGVFHSGQDIHSSIALDELIINGGKSLKEKDEGDKAYKITDKRQNSHEPWDNAKTLTMWQKDRRNNLQKDHIII